MSKNKEKVLQEFENIKQYFLDIQLNDKEVNGEKVIQLFTKITTSILFEQDEKTKK